MTRFRLFLFLAVLTLALGACGNSNHPATARSCNPNDYAMSCNTAHQNIRALGGLPPTAIGRAYGFDFAWACPNPGGWSFGASYLDSYDRSKGWSIGCLNYYHSLHKGTVNVWETTAARALAGRAAGVSDARQALNEVIRLHVPTSRPIYFAVDFDTTGRSCWSSICPYFQGIVAVLGANRTGVYGGRTTMEMVHVNGLARYYWQSGSWSYGVWVSYANIEQYAYPNNVVDYDRAMTVDYGQSPLLAPPLVDVDPHHYKWFERGPFTSAWGKLNERNVVVHYDGARKHPGKYRQYLAVLRQRLQFLANRVYVIAHQNKRHPTWNKFHRGWRYQYLIQRAHGKQFA